MKHVKLLCLATALLLSVCLAGCESNEAKIRPNISMIQYDHFSRLRVLCVNGYSYLARTEYGSGGLTQMWEDGPSGPRPMQCAPPPPEKPVP